MENNYWYVGQKVSDQRFGNGEIVRIDTTASCPILVDFNGCREAYYIDGKYTESTLPCLSQNPHVPLEYNNINKIFKKGEVVWYCPSNGLWYLGVYDSLEEGKHKVNTGYENNKAFIFEYLTDEQIKKFIELKV